MKIILTAILLLIIQIKNEIDTSKMLIIFFTRTGNTELFSNDIKECLNIKSFKIIPVKDYPSDSSEMSLISVKEKSENARPEIKAPLTNIANYDKILLGYPIWNSYLPCIVITQLLKLDFTGKTIYPFITHEGSGVGNSFDEIKLYTPGAIVKKGFCLKGSDIRNKKEESMKEIKQWLKGNFGYQYDSAKKFRFELIIILIMVSILIF